MRVFGIKGRPPTDKLKVSIAYRAGFKAVGTLVYAWPDALAKAQLADRVLRERLDRLGLEFDQILTEFVGASATHGRLAGDAARPAEVQLRVGVRGDDRAAVERFTREIAPLVLNGPPSVTGFAGGRPKVEEIVAYWPALIDKQVVAHEGRGARREGPPARHRARPLGRQGRHRQRRRDRARTASGIRCSSDISRATASRSTSTGVITGDVERFELPNLNALNFLLHGALDGGGTLSLKTDAQGKVFSTALLRLVLDVPDAEARDAGLMAR